MVMVMRVIEWSNVDNAADELDLVDEARRDRAAFGPLYHRYADRVYRY
jgi:hypothetical protein